MFTVSTELKKRVNDKIAECAHKSGIDCGKIEVRYDINSKRLGGQALLRDNVIRLNPVYLNAHTEHYINDTVVHEWAHLAAHKKYGRYISAHGNEWKNTMRAVGVVPSRTHNYTVPEGVKVGKQTTKYAIVCNKCGEKMECGPKVFAKLNRGASYKHNRCGGTIAPVGKVAAAKPAAPAPSSIPKTGSKKDQCVAIYKAYHKVLDRQGLITAFVKNAGCTPAGAATYYSTIKKEIG